MSDMSTPALTIQLCTFNRAHLLGRVLQGCFEQTTHDYEVVLVNDGSSDHTEAVIAAAQAQATVPFTVIHQANRGLACGRNAGIAQSRGKRIAFIDDDVLPMPNFVAEHLRTGERHPHSIVRGAVIMTPSFEHLPPPIYSWKDYSANFFWTSNVSVPRATLDEVGHFHEAFREYGWEDIELGLRLRFAGVRGYFNRDAVAFHYKAPPKVADLPSMFAQARAQARTAFELLTLHPHWRVWLAIGQDPLQRSLRALARPLQRFQPDATSLSALPPEHVLTPRELRQARQLAQQAYHEEFSRAAAQHQAT